MSLRTAILPLPTHFRSFKSLEVRRKPDATLLSEADEAVQAEIIRILRIADPDATILTEEGRLTRPTLEPFGLLYRQQQKIWDGFPGICFAYATGLNVTNGDGQPKTEIDFTFDVANPVFDSTLVASAPTAAHIVASGFGTRSSI
jgi:fructose-1,6-bisphosphatase/inositol monophosphatase family enzyme